MFITPVKEWMSEGFKHLFFERDQRAIQVLRLLKDGDGTSVELDIKAGKRGWGIRKDDISILVPYLERCGLACRSRIGIIVITEEGRNFLRCLNGS